MTGLRRRTEEELSQLTDACLHQLSAAPCVTGWNSREPDETKTETIQRRRERMRRLLQAAGMEDDVSNPCVGRLFSQFTGTQVLRAVCDVTGFEKSELLGERRHAKIAKARQIFMKLCFERARQMSKTQIGKVIRRDHTTVIHGLRAAEKSMNTSPEFRDMYHKAAAALETA